MTSLSVHDPNSFSNPEDVRVENMLLKWYVDFSRKVIAGTIVYDLVSTKDVSQQKIVLDTHSLEIKSVSDGRGQMLEYEVGDAFMTMGRPLSVQLLEFTKELKSTLVIEYETAPTCEALQWLEPSQTHGKEFPYLFSQCQAIHARSLLPCQDTPFVKSTYKAEIEVDSNLVVLVSGIETEKPKPTDNNNCTHYFEQTVPIPSYLIAIVVGKLESIELGPRSRVWSEKAFLEKAAIDFSETEQMLQSAEKLMGKYVWGRYDILVLPPSFPYGGMENPCLTFLTPTLLTGDRSLASVVAHEITHSWTGNLVTNKNFEHFWLNEGFTRFVERKIVGILHGERMRQFECHLGWSELDDCVRTLGATNPLTQLVVNLKGVDPEDAFSRIPYEKGSTFLYYLEEKVGGPEVFEPFLRDYISEYAYKSIDTPVFKEYFEGHFTKLGKDISDIDWDKWLYSPGMPVLKPDYDTTLLNACISLKDRWISWNPEVEPSSFSKEDFENFHPNQIVEFMNQLFSTGEPFSVTKAKAMEQAYDFGESTNSEILFRWIRLICKAQWLDKLPMALDFVTKNGRMKFIQPIYRDLYKWEEARSQTIDTFQRNRPFMMAGSVFVTAKNLGLRE